MNVTFHKTDKSKLSEKGIERLKMIANLNQDQNLIVYKKLGVHFIKSINMKAYEDGEFLDAPDFDKAMESLRSGIEIFATKAALKSRLANMFFEEQREIVLAGYVGK